MSSLPPLPTPTNPSVEYTEDEYNLYLSNSEWTRSDTDKLMGLCRRLDLRWAVIHDQVRTSSSDIKV